MRIQGPDPKPTRREKPEARGLQAKPGYRMPTVSRRQARENAERAPVRSAFMLSHPICQARIEDVCTGAASDMHEPLTRARGGSISDESNALALCHHCHMWIHNHPAKSLEMGWLKRA